MQTEVQVYRSMYMRKTRYDMPDGEEYELWKQQLPEWLNTKKLNAPNIPTATDDTDNKE